MERPTGMERPARRATVQFAVNEGVKAEVVHRALDRLFKLSGCPSCGLLGIDVHLRVSDPEFVRMTEPIAALQHDVHGLEGVRGVAILEGIG